MVNDGGQHIQTRCPFLNNKIDKYATGIKGGFHLNLRTYGFFSVTQSGKLSMEYVGQNLEKRPWCKD